MLTCDGVRLFRPAWLCGALAGRDGRTPVRAGMLRGKHRPNGQMLCRHRWTSMHGKRTDIAAYVLLACVDGIAAHAFPVCADGNAVCALPCRQCGVCPFPCPRGRQYGICPSLSCVDGSAARRSGKEKKRMKTVYRVRQRLGRGEKRRSAGAGFPAPSASGCRMYCKMAGQCGRMYCKMAGQCGRMYCKMAGSMAVCTVR